METARGFSVLMILVVNLCASMNVYAQNSQPILQFGRLLRPTAQVAGPAGTSEAGTIESRSRAGVHDRNVQRNITRHRVEAARLAHAAKSLASLPVAVRSPLGVAATGSISGTIFQDDGVTPVDYGSVTVYNQFGIYSGYGYVSTSDAGAYTVPNLPSGSYYVQAATFGAIYMQEYYDGASDWRDATLVKVVNGLNTKNVDVVMKKHGGAVAGRVCSADGAPLSDCMVDVYDASQDDITYAIADSFGYFTVGGLPAGDYRLRATSFGDDNYVAAWYGGAATFHNAAVVHVVDPYLTGGVNFFLNVGGEIAGRVVTENGDSVAAGTCSIYALDAEGNEVGYAQNGSGGRFFVPRLPSGSYILNLDYYGLDNYVGGWYDGAPDELHATQIHVSAPDTATVTYALQRGGAIAGVILYNPASGIAVTAWDDQKEQVRTVYSDGTGHFLLTQLVPGRYRIRASTKGSPYFYAGQAVDRWYPDAADFTHAAPLNVRASDTTTGISLTLQPGGTIAGSILDQNGALVTGGAVVACNTSGADIQYVSVTTAGTYQIEGLPTGQYKLYYESTAAQGYPLEWYDGQATCQDAAVINVSAPSTMWNTDFHLKNAALLDGFVDDNSGVRLSSDDHAIEMILFEGDAGHFAGSVMQSFNGGFQARVMPGKYRAGFFSVAWNSDRNRDSLAVAYYENGRRFTDTSTKFISLAAGSTVTLNDCRMERTASAISGAVIDRGTGSPVTNGLYVIVAFDEDGLPAGISGYTNLNGPISGSYRIAGLRPGKYYILVLAGNLNAGYTVAQWYGNVDVSPDSVTNVPIPLVPPGAATITVGQGTTSGIDFHMGVTTAIAGPSGAASPRSFVLDQNYPNPFNPSTSIQYQIPSAARVTLVVYDMLGREVATLEDGTKQAGTYTVKFNASRLASGVYLYRLKAGNFSQAKKLLLVR